MSHYRLYFMSPWSGHIQRFAEYEAADDQSALAIARDQEGEFALELWCERRKVARVGPADSASGIDARWQIACEARLHAVEFEASVLFAKASSVEL